MNVLIYNLTCGVLPEVKSAFDGHRAYSGSTILKTRKRMKM